MKNIVLLFYFCFISTSLVAQHMTEKAPFKLRLYSGLSLPMGDFASESGEKAGLATTGFLVMLEAASPMSPIIDLTFSLTLAQNSFNDTKASEQLSPIDVSAGSYYMTWFMGGLQIGPESYNGSRFYIAGNLGLLFPSFPDITLQYQGSKSTIVTESKVAVGYGFGAGVQLDKINIGIRYLSATPSYTQKVERSTGRGFDMELPASVLLVMIGFTF